MTDTTTRTRPDSTSDEWLEYAAELGRRNKENAEKMRGLLESVTRDNGEIGRISERIRETSAQIQTLKDEEEQISGEIDEYYREIKVSISDLEDSYFQELDQAKGKVRELGETADRYRSEVEAKLGEPTPKGSTMLPKKLRRTLMGEAADSLMDVLMREKGYFTHADLWPAILEKVRAENPGTRFYEREARLTARAKIGVFIAHGLLRREKVDKENRYFVID